MSKNIEMNLLMSDGSYEVIYPVPASHASSHSSDGSDPITPSSIGASAKPITYTVTVPTTSWSTDSTGGYYKSITVSGILSSDIPFADVSLGSSFSTNETYLKMWSKVTRIVSGANKITIYTKEIPTTSYTLRLVVIR